MTTLNEAREAIYQRFVDNYVATVFTFENEDFDPPETAWVRLSVRGNVGGGQETLGAPGGRKFRRRGIIVAQVYTPLNQGLQQGDQLGQSIRAIFEAEGFSDIDANDGLVRESPPRDDFFVHIVEVFFEYEETK